MLIYAFVMMAKGGSIIVDSHVYDHSNLIYNPSAEQNYYKFTKCTFANTTKSGIRINDQNSISTIEIVLCYFYNCYDDFSGGGIYIYDSKEFDISNTCFDSCDVGEFNIDSPNPLETRGAAAYTEGTHGDLNIFSNTVVTFRPNTPSGGQMDFHAKIYNMANNNFTNAKGYYVSGLEVRDPINVRINYLHFQNVTGQYAMSLSGDYNINCQLSTSLHQLTFIRCQIPNEWSVVLYEFQATGLVAEDVYIFQISPKSYQNYRLFGAMPNGDAYITIEIKNLITDVSDRSHYINDLYGGHCTINNVKICGIDYCFIPITAANMGKCQLATAAPLSPTHKFTASRSFTPSSRFTASRSFTPSSRFTASRSFTPSRQFTASNLFTQSEQFMSNIITEFNQFTPNFISQSAVFSTKVNEGNHIKVNDERRDRANMRAIIGGSVGGFIFLLLLILLILFIIYKTSQHAIEDSSDTNEDPNDQNNFDEFLLESEGEGTIDPTDKEEGIESYQNDPNTACFTTTPSQESDDALSNSNTNDDNDIMSPEDGNDTIEDVYQQDDQDDSIFIINTEPESESPEIVPVVIAAPFIAADPDNRPKKKKKIRRRKKIIVNQREENETQEFSTDENNEEPPKAEEINKIESNEGEEGIHTSLLITTESEEPPMGKKKIIRRKKRKTEIMIQEDNSKILELTNENNDELPKIDKEINAEDVT